jgi:hypothetical protein
MAEYIIAEACKVGDISYLEEKRKEGYDLHADNELLLRMCSEQGYFDVVEYLIKQGADVNIVNGRAIDWAIINQHISIIKLLIENGCKVSGKKQLMSGCLRHDQLEYLKPIVEKSVRNEKIEWI